ncbi:MAG: pncB [Labilithrix sp.]|nr:pncB [Labilithrix sp.]
MREGRVFFPDEPVLEADAPSVEAQLVETSLLDAIHYPTLVASKAVRCVAAARGRDVVELGLRGTPRPLTLLVDTHDTLRGVEARAPRRTSRLLPPPAQKARTAGRSSRR